MKLGLVPLLYDEYNYGGVLQFFALQYVLKKNGFECDIIKYDNEDRIIDNEIQPSVGVLSIVKKTLRRIYNYKKNHSIEKATKHRKSKIDSFKNKYYSKMVNSNNIEYSDYLGIVCGSDQIWNPKWARKRCFLEFVPDETKKIIYAASLGVEKLDDNEKDLFKWRVERLQHVSVREHSAKRILDSFIDRDDIKVVLDPTLLLCRSDWETISKHNKVPKDDYIFTYFLGDYSKIKNEINKFARIENLKIINIPFASGERYDGEKFGDIKVTDASPDEFIGLIENAKYIFTDSFHACVFSYIFQKEFYVFERDGSKSMMGRIHTLFSNLNIPDRIIHGNKINIVPRIDYSHSDKKHQILREQSIAYILESINER